MINILVVCPEITKGMKSLGSKSLLRLKKNLTLIEYQIAQLQKIKPSHITINIGFDSDRIQEKLSRYKSINFLVNNQYEKTNQAKNLLDYIHKFNPDNLLIISSGLLFKNNLLSKKYLKNNCKIFLLNKNKTNFSIGCSETEPLEYLFYDMQKQWSEIFYLNKEAIEILKKQNPKHLTQMYFFEIINLLLKNHVKFEKILIDKTNIMKVNNIHDLSSAKVFV